MLNEKLEDGIIIATFEHRKTNSLTLEILRKLRDIVKKSNEDDAVKGIVLTGAEGPSAAGSTSPCSWGSRMSKRSVTSLMREKRSFWSFSSAVNRWFPP